MMYEGTDTNRGTWVNNTVLISHTLCFSCLEVWALVHHCLCTGNQRKSCQVIWQTCCLALWLLFVSITKLTLEPKRCIEPSVVLHVQQRKSERDGNSKTWATSTTGKKERQLGGDNATDGYLPDLCRKGTIILCINALHKLSRRMRCWQATAQRGAFSLWVIQLQPSVTVCRFHGEHELWIGCKLL